jgi:hypothetical protein
MRIRAFVPPNYRLPDDYISPEAERAAKELKAQEESQAESEALAADIARLQAKRVELLAEMDAIRARLGSNGNDLLCYLPRSAVSPEFMHKACTYLESFRHRVEAAGAKTWLCADHDFRTRVFHVTEFREMNGSVFCSGEWCDPKYRDAYKGVSPDFAVFAADSEIVKELGRNIPDGCGSMEDLPSETRIAASSPRIFGLAGACCLNIEPAYGRTRIR